MMMNSPRGKLPPSRPSQLQYRGVPARRFTKTRYIQHPVASEFHRRTLASIKTKNISDKS